MAVDPNDPLSFSPDTKPAFLDPERARTTVPPEYSPQVHAAGPQDPVKQPLRFDSESPDLGVEPDPPGVGVRERHRFVARLAALGLTPTAIGDRTGYSPNTVCIMIRTPWIAWQIARYRSIADTDVQGTIREAAIEGASVIRELINNPATRDNVRLDAAKFMVEKSTGKARQEVDHNHGTLGDFMKLLAERRQRVEPISVTPARDVTPALPAASESREVAANPWDDWISKNLTSQAR